MARINISVRWWVVPYARALALFARLTGQEIDGEKLAGLIARRGIRVIASER